MKRDGNNIAYLRLIGTSDKSISIIRKFKKKKPKVKKKKRVLVKVHTHKKKNVVIESFGEKELAKLLDRIEVKYIKEKKFKGLVGKEGGQLRYDFYLPSHNAIIEYDGIHHFKKTDYSSNLAKVQSHDKIKDNYCIKNNIPILRLTRNDIDTLTETITTFLDTISNN